MTTEGLDQLGLFTERDARSDPSVKAQKFKKLADIIAQDKTLEVPGAAVNTALPLRRTHASASRAVSREKMVVESNTGSSSRAASTEVIDLRGFSDGEAPSTQMKIAGRQSGVETKNGLRKSLGRKSKELDMGAAQSGQKISKGDTGVEKAPSKTGGTKAVLPSVKKSTDGVGSSVQKKGSKKEGDVVKRGPGRPRKEDDGEKLRAGRGGKDEEAQKRGPGRSKREEEVKKTGSSKMEEGPKRGADKPKPEVEKRAVGNAEKDGETGGGVQEYGQVGGKGKQANMPPGGARSAPEKAVGKSVADEKVGQKRKGELATEGGEKEAKRQKGDGVKQMPSKGAADGKVKESVCGAVAKKGVSGGGQTAKVSVPAAKAAKNSVPSKPGPRKGGIRATFEALKLLRGPRAVDPPKTATAQEQKVSAQLASGGTTRQGETVDNAAADSDGHKSSEATESDEEVVGRARAAGKKLETEGDPSAKASKPKGDLGAEGAREAVLKSADEAQPMEVDSKAGPSNDVTGKEHFKADATPVAESSALVMAVGAEEGKGGLEGVESSADKLAGESGDAQPAEKSADAGKGGLGTAPEAGPDSNSPQGNGATDGIRGKLAENDSSPVEQGAASVKEPAEVGVSGSVQADTVLLPPSATPKGTEDSVKAVEGGTQGVQEKPESASVPELRDGKLGLGKGTHESVMEVQTGGSNCGAKDRGGDAGPGDTHGKETSGLSKEAGRTEAEACELEVENKGLVPDETEGGLRREKGVRKERGWESREGGERRDSTLEEQLGGVGLDETVEKEAGTEQEGLVANSPGAEGRNDEENADRSGGSTEAVNARAEREDGAESSGDEKAHGTPMNEEEGRDGGEEKEREPVPEKMATRGLGKRERVPVRRILEEEELPQRASRLGTAKLADKYASRTKGGYRCDICGAIFANGQALGGHKSSHKGSDAFTEEEKRSNAKKGTRAPFQKGQKSPDSPEVGRERPLEPPVKLEWTCEICGLTFPNGQALGGHKGSHKSTFSNTTLEKPSPRPSTFRSTRLQRRSEEKSIEKAQKDNRADDEDSSEGAGTPRTRGEGAFVKKLPMSLRPKDRLQSLAAIVSKKSRRIVSVDEEDREKSSKRIAERLRRTADGARKRPEPSGALSPRKGMGMDSFEEDAVAGLMVLRQPITLSLQRERIPERNRRKRARVNSDVPQGRKSDDSSTLAAAKVLLGKNRILEDSDAELSDSDAEMTDSDEYEDADAAFSSGAEKSGREERGLLSSLGVGGRQSSEPTRSGEDRPRRPETRTKEERRATRKLRGSSDEEEVRRPRNRERGAEPKRMQGEKRGGEKKLRPRPPRTGLLSELAAHEGSVSSRENELLAAEKVQPSVQGKGSGESTGGDKEEENIAAVMIRDLAEVLEEGRKERAGSDRDSYSSDEPLAGAFHRVSDGGKRSGRNRASPAVSPLVIPRRESASPTPYVIPIMEEAEAAARLQELSDEELPLSALRAGTKKKKSKGPVYGPGSRVPPMVMLQLILQRNREQCELRDKAERLEKARLKPPMPTPGFKVPGLVASKPGLVSKGGVGSSKGLEGEETAETRKRKRREDVIGAEKTKKKLLGGEKEVAESRNGSPSDAGTNMFSLGMRRPWQPPAMLQHEGGEFRPFVPEINAQMVLDFLKGVQTVSKGPAEPEAHLGGEQAVGRAESDSGDEDAPIGLLSKFRSPEKRAWEMHPPERRLPEKRPVEKHSALGGSLLAGPPEEPKKARKRHRKTDGGASGITGVGALGLPATGGSVSDPGSLTEQNSASETEDLPIGKRAPDAPAPAANPVAGYTEINRKPAPAEKPAKAGKPSKADIITPFKESGLDLEEEIQKAVQESVVLIQHYKLARKMCLKADRLARKQRRKAEEAAAALAGIPEEETEVEGKKSKLKSKRSKEKALLRSVEPPADPSQDLMFLGSFPPAREQNNVQLAAPPENRPRHVSSSVNDFLEKLGIKDFVEKTWPSNAPPSGLPMEPAPQPSDGLRFRPSDGSGRPLGESDRPLADFVGIPPVRPSYTVLTEEDELSNAYRALKSAVEAGQQRRTPERERLDLNTGLSLGGMPRAAPSSPAPFLRMLQEGGARLPGTPPPEPSPGQELGAFFRDKGVVKNGKWHPMTQAGEKREAPRAENRGVELGRGDESALWSRTETRGQPDLPLVKTGLAQFLGRGVDERPGGALKAGLARPSSHDSTRERLLPNKGLDLNMGATLPARRAPPATLPGSPLIAPVWKSVSERELLSREWELPNWLPTNLNGTREIPPPKRPYAPPRFNPRDQTGVSGPPLFNGPQPNVWKDKDAPPVNTGVSGPPLFNNPLTNGWKEKDGPPVNTGVSGLRNQMGVSSLRDQTGVSGLPLFNKSQQNVWKDKGGSGPSVSDRAWPELLKQRQEGIHTGGDAEPAAVLKGRDVHRRPSPGFLELHALGDAVRDGPLFSDQEILETRARGLGLGGSLTELQAPGSLQHENIHLMKSAATLRRLLGKNESLTSPAIRSYAEGVNKMVQEGSKLLPDPKPLTIPNLDEPIHSNNRSSNGAPLAGFPVRSTAPAVQPEAVTGDRADWAKVTTSKLPGWLASEVEKRRKGE